MLTQFALDAEGPGADRDRTQNIQEREREREGDLNNRSRGVFSMCTGSSEGEQSKMKEEKEGK